MGLFNTEKTEQEYADMARKYLLDGETLIKAGRNWEDWVALTNKRLMIVDIDHDAKIRTFKQLTSVPLSTIVEVNQFYGENTDIINIVTLKRKHPLNMGKNNAKQFSDAILNQIL